MTGVFISYTRSDVALARRVRLGLKSLGVDAIWDESMPSVDWQDFLHDKITDLSAVIVIWTPKSKSSKSVKAEARLAHGVDKLINVLSGMPQPPWPFDDINGLSLDGWTGTTPHVGWTRLIETVDGFLERRNAAARGALITALSQQEAEMRDRRAAIPKAERALTRAGIEHENLQETLTLAQAEFDQAAKQVLDLQQMKVSKAVMYAAHAEHDEAKAALLATREQVTDSAEAISGERAAVERLKYDFDNWLISIGADIDPEKADDVEMQAGTEDVPTDTALPLLSTKTADAPTAAPTAKRDVEPAAGVKVADGNQAATTVEPEVDADPQPGPETASLETGGTAPVASATTFLENLLTAYPDPARSAETLKQPPSSVSSSRDTIRRPRRSFVNRNFGAAAIVLGGLLLLLSIYYFVKTSKPVESGMENATVAGTEALQNTAQPSTASAPEAKLQAPDWVLGKWGIERDCSNILLFTKETGANLGVQVGETGPVSIENILEKTVAELSTNEARYILELPYMTRIKVFPRGSDSYGLKRCP